jgi:hypothetical protein
MKWLQNGNLAKLVAFFVIAVVITCTVSFAANGWQSFVNDDSNTDNVTSDNKKPSGDDVDENQEKEDNEQEIPVVLPTPKYYHAITGLETDLETSFKRPLCLCFEVSDPLYGISASYLTIEFPTEYGNTRLLCFTDDTDGLGKIGSLAPTRGYISNLASYFGGVLLSYGADDSLEYDHFSPAGKLNFAATSGYCYSEYNTFIYTNGDLVNAFINNTGINTTLKNSVSLPYSFSDINSGGVSGDKVAKNIQITFSDSNITELIYSFSDKKYVLSKNSSQKTDLLNDKCVSYDNVFILYANSTTYETANNTQFILDTAGSGSGVYITGGTSMNIKWERDVKGNLTFLTENGEKLLINRGTSYISFVKSSNPNSVKIS